MNVITQGVRTLTLTKIFPDIQSMFPLHNGLEITENAYI